MLCFFKSPLRFGGHFSLFHYIKNILHFLIYQHIGNQKIYLCIKIVTCLPDGRKHFFSS